MTYLIFGLVLFLGVHSVQMLAAGWRAQAVARLGLSRYKALYSALSLVGFVLLVWGFRIAREAPLVLWAVPAGLRHATGLLTLVAFIFLAAAYIPRNAIKARLHHPMVLAVKTWALAHLLVNGNAAHVLLFGSFLGWAVVNYVLSRRRDRAQGVTYPSSTLAGTVSTVLVGAAAWAVFAFWLHSWLIGVRPLG